jgi:accessory gene regulator B
LFSKISNYVTDMIYDTLPGIEPERREVIEYGVYMTVSEIIKMIVTIIAAAVIGVVPHVMCVIVVFGLQRMLLGGVHAKSHWGCMISHSAIVFSVVALSFVSYVDRLYLMIPIVTFSYITAYKYAPADLPQKPVKSKRQRKQLRAVGYALLAVLFTAAYFLDRTWSNIILFTCFIQSALMTPLAYRITKNKYGREEASV